MSKTKTPLLSLGSQGTVGGFLTTQKSGKTTILREKPVPTDPKSLAQMYQRWDYQDGIFYWQTLSLLVKSAWRVVGSRKHMTGFAAFMSNYLKNLPDLALRYHLDFVGGNTVPDSSKNANTGTLFGTTSLSGAIHMAHLFDGIDDYINCGHGSSLDITDAITIEFFMNSPLTWPHAYALCRIVYKLNCYMMNMDKNTGSIASMIYDAGGWHQVVLNGADIDANTTHHVTFTYDGATLTAYVDGAVSGAPVAYAGDIDSNPANDLLIATDGVRDYKGWLDHFCIYNRALSLAQVQNHAERRYP